MPTLTREIREQLITSDPEYQKLAKLHSEYKAHLEELAAEEYLNLEDLQEEVRLKKLKLHVKDEMEKYLAERARQMASQ